MTADEVESLKDMAKNHISDKHKIMNLIEENKGLNARFKEKGSIAITITIIKEFERLRIENDRYKTVLLSDPKLERAFDLQRDVLKQVGKSKKINLNHKRDVDR